MAGALLASYQGTSAGVVAAHPVKALLFLVGMVLVSDEKLARVGAYGVAGAGLFVLLFECFSRRLVEVVELPERGVGHLVIDDVFDVVTAFEDERLEPFFGELFGGPSS